MANKPNTWKDMFSWEGITNAISKVADKFNPQKYTSDTSTKQSIVSKPTQQVNIRPKETTTIFNIPKIPQEKYNFQDETQHSIFIPETQTKVDTFSGGLGEYYVQDKLKSTKFLLKEAGSNIKSFTERTILNPTEKLVVDSVRWIADTIENNRKKEARSIIGKEYTPSRWLDMSLTATERSREISKEQAELEKEIMSYAGESKTGQQISRHLLNTADAVISIGKWGATWGVLPFVETYTSKYGEVMDFTGGDRPRASNVALLNASVEYILEKLLGAEKLLGGLEKAYAGKGYKQLLSGVISENIEEFLELLAGNTIDKYGYDKSRNLFEGWIDTMIATSGSSGLFGLAGLAGGRTTAQRTMERQGKADYKPNDDQVYFTQKIFGLNKQQAIDMIQGINNELAAANEVKFREEQAETTPQKDFTQGLMEEARKYKSAEEFVNNQKILYHGTSLENANKINTEGFKVGAGKGVSGQASNDFVYATGNKVSANKYVSDRLGIKNPTVVDGGFNGKVLEVKGKMADFEAFGEASKKLGVPFKIGSQGKPTMLNMPAIKKAMQEQGYGAISFSDRYANGSKAFAILPENIKTKSQLTDIWNKANQPTDLISEAKKYKTADEFVKAQENILPKEYNVQFTKLPKSFGYKDGGSMILFKGDEKIATAKIDFVKGKMVVNEIGTIGGIKGTGEGTLLLKYIEQQAKEKGAQEILAEVVLPESVGYWEKQGYSAIGEEYGSPIMSKSLKTKSQLTDIWNKAQETNVLTNTEKFGKIVSDNEYRLGITSVKGYIPVEADKLVDEGIELEKNGDFNEAQSKYKEALIKSGGIDTLRNILESIDGVNIVTIEPSIGRFFGNTEPTIYSEVEIPKEVIDETVRLLSDYSDNVNHQKSLLIYKEVPSTSKLGIIDDTKGLSIEPAYSLRFDKQLELNLLKNIDDLLKNYNILVGGSWSPDLKTYDIINLSKFNQDYGKFIEEVNDFTQNLNRIGLYPRVRKSIQEVRHIGKTDEDALTTYDNIERISVRSDAVRSQKPKKETKYRREIKLEDVSIKSGLAGDSFQIFNLDTLKYETLGTTEDLSEDTRSKYIEAKNKLQLAEESKSPDTKAIAREYLTISEIAKQEIIDSQTKQKQEAKKETKPKEDKLAQQIKDSYKETKTDRELTPEEKKKLKSLNKLIFGDEKVEIVERLTTKDGHKALGAYIDGIIKIVDGKANPQDTYLHEAVHKYIDLFMSQSEKVNLFLAAKEKYGDLKVANLEEKIAEGFIKYMNTRTGIFGKLKLAFDTLSNRIKLYLIPDNRQSIEDFYNDIATGKAKAVSQELKVAKEQESLKKQADRTKKIIKKEKEKKKISEKLSKRQELTSFKEALKKQMERFQVTEKFDIAQEWSMKIIDRIGQELNDKFDRKKTPEERTIAKQDSKLRKLKTKRYKDIAKLKLLQKEKLFLKEVKSREKIDKVIERYKEKIAKREIVLKVERRAKKAIKALVGDYKVQVKNGLAMFKLMKKYSPSWQLEQFARAFNDVITEGYAYKASIKQGQDEKVSTKVANLQDYTSNSWGERMLDLIGMSKQERLEKSNTLKRVGSWVSDRFSFLNSAFLPESMIRYLGKMKDNVNNLYYQYLYEPINEAKNEYYRRYNGSINAYNHIMAMFGLRGNELLKFLSEKVEVAGVSRDLSGDERVGVLLLMDRTKGREYLIRNNGFTDLDLYKIRQSATRVEQKIANFMREQWKLEQKDLVDAVLQSKKKDLKLDDFYVPIKMNKKRPVLKKFTNETGQKIEEPMAIPETKFEESDIETLGKNLNNEMMNAMGRVPKGFTKAATGGGKYEVVMSATQLYFQHAKEAAHYISLVNRISEVDKILHSDFVQQMILTHFGEKGVRVMDKWLKDSAKIESSRYTSEAESFLERLRNNAIKAIATLNVRMMLKQPVSFLAVVGEVGPANALKGTIDFFFHRNEVNELITTYAPQIDNRGFIYGNEAIKESINLAEKVANGKLNWADKSTQIRMFNTNLKILTSSLDRVAVRSGWMSAFNYYIKANPGASKSEAAKYASSVIRRTQAFGEVKDTSDLQRAGIIGRVFTTFQNEQIKQFNYLWFDIIQKSRFKKDKATVTMRKVGFQVAGIAILIEILNTMKQPEDWEEFAKNVGYNSLELVPIIGSILSNLLQGRDTDLTLLEAPRYLLRAYQQAQGKTAKTRAKAPYSAAKGLSSFLGMPIYSIDTIKNIVDIVNGGDAEIRKFLLSPSAYEATKSNTKPFSGKIKPRIKPKLNIKPKIKFK